MTATTLDTELEQELGGGEPDDVTAEELAAIRRIRKRAEGRQHTPYRKALLARIEAARNGASPEEVAAIPIPGGAYATYRLSAGSHRRLDLKDVADARRRTIAFREERGPASPTVDAKVHAFRPSDLITPETDAEALMIDQDPNKFRPVGPSQSSDNVDVLTAEINRLKQTAGRGEDLDRREAELAKQAAEVARQAAELDKARAELAKGHKK